MTPAATLTTLGVLFAVGLCADQLGRRTRIPRVTLLLLSGLLAGSLELLPRETQAWTDNLTVTALTLVAFLLGGSLRRDMLRAHGAKILLISVCIVLCTLVITALGLMALGVSFGLALILASIASATAPAATNDVIRQTGIENGFTDTVKGVVAIDDAWGLLAFSLCMTLALGVEGAGAGGEISVLADIGGAALLGLLIGVPAAVLTGRIDPGEPLQIEVLALAFLTAGLALWLDVSFLIAGMVAGAVIANMAVHHRRAFHEIEHIQWPFMIVFFILAGAGLELSMLPQLGPLGLAFFGLRAVSRLLGGWLGATVAKAPPRHRWLYGPALMPQAGVAIGMALIAGQTFPQWSELIMTLTIGTTVLFELTGPLATSWAVQRSVTSA